MTRARNSSAAVAFALVAILGLIALLGAAATEQRPIAFSLDIPPTAPVMTLYPGHAACEGPIQTSVAFAAVQAYLAPIAAPGAALDLTVSDSQSGATLATGHLASGYGIEIGPSIALDSTVLPGRSVVVCFHSKGPRPVALFGGPGGPELTQTFAGKPTAAHVGLIFLRPHPRSLLSLLPAVFERAALFHPRWVGAWTFWVLTVALLAAFGLAGFAVAAAARGDAARERGGSDT